MRLFYVISLPSLSYSNSIKQLIQFQFSNNKQENVSELKKFENSFLPDKNQIKDNLTYNNSNLHNNQIGSIRINSISKQEKKSPISHDNLLISPSTAASDIKSTRSISKNVSLKKSKIDNNLVKNDKKYPNDNRTKINMKDFTLESKLTLSPSNNDRFNQYSPNKIKNIQNSYEFKLKNFPINENIANKKGNFLIQSLNVAKSNINLLVDNISKENFDFQPSSIQKYESVKDIASKEEQNPRYRQAMEDFIKMIDKYNGDPNSSLFTLYDGHGGKDAAIYSKEKFPEYFSKFLMQMNDPEKALTMTFHKIDLDLKNRNIANENVGTTASVVYISKENDSIYGSKKVLYAANVGDSRIIILQNNGPKKISYDHRCNDINEINRVKNAGGIIFNCRVFGQLALTRAIGDHSLKKYGVIATPYTTKVYLDEKDKYIIIASDGVWDSLNDNDVYKLSLNHNGVVELANAIVKSSISKGSKDNTSCIVVRLE